IDVRRVGKRVELDVQPVTPHEIAERAQAVKVTRPIVLWQKVPQGAVKHAEHADPVEAKLLTLRAESRHVLAIKKPLAERKIRAAERRERRARVERKESAPDTQPREEHRGRLEWRQRNRPGFRRSWPEPDLPVTRRELEGVFPVRDKSARLD